MPLTQTWDGTNGHQGYIRNIKCLIQSMMVTFLKFCCGCSISAFFFFIKIWWSVLLTLLGNAVVAQNLPEQI